MEIQETRSDSEACDLKPDFHPMPRLSILHTLSETLRLLLRESRFWGAIIIGPVLAITAINLTARIITQKTAETALTVLLLAVLMFSWVRFAVSCHRFMLLGEQPSSFLEGCRWQMRDTWFALYGIGIYLFGWFFIFMAGLGTVVLSPYLALLPNWSLSVLLGLGAIAMWLFFSYLMGRLSLILPATAIDKRPATEWVDWAWSRSEGNEWPLMFLLGINPTVGWTLLNGITGAMIKHANESSAYLATPIYCLAWALYFLATAFHVAVLSLSLKALSTQKEEPQVPETVS